MSWDLFLAVLTSVLNTDLLFAPASPGGLMSSFSTLSSRLQNLLLSELPLDLFPHRWPASKAHHFCLVMCLPLNTAVEWCWSQTDLSFTLNPNTCSLAESFRAVYLPNSKMVQLRPVKRTAIHYPSSSFPVSSMLSLLAIPTPLLKLIAGMASNWPSCLWMLSC